MLQNILAAIKLGCRFALTWLRKYAPQLCITAGVGTLAYAPFNAVKRSGKYEPQENEEGEITWKEKTASFIKTYWPTILIVLAGAGLTFLGSHLYMKAILAVSTALSALNAKFNEYRKRNILAHGEAGEQFDKYCMGNGTLHKLEDGQTAIQIHDDPDNKFEFIFGPDCRKGKLFWTVDKAENLRQLVSLERDLNYKGWQQGHVLVNDICDAVGAPRTARGSEQGFIFDEAHPEKWQNSINFDGIHEIDTTDTNPVIKFTIHADGKVNQLI